MNLTTQWHVTAPGAPDVFCRCQNPAAKSLKVTGDSISSGSGIDHLVLFGDTNNPVKLDYLIVSGPEEGFWPTTSGVPVAIGRRLRYTPRIWWRAVRTAELLEEVVSDRNSSEGTESEVGVGTYRSCNVASGLYYDVDPELDSDNCPAQISAVGDGICSACAVSDSCSNGST